MQNKKFITIVQEALQNECLQALPRIEKELEERVTFYFMYNNAYLVDLTSIKKNKKYKLKNTQSLHDIDGYETLNDFLQTLTGDDTWHEEEGLQNYNSLLIEQFSNELMGVILNVLKETNIDPENIVATPEDEKKFIELFASFIEYFWRKWSAQSFKKVIEENFKSIQYKDKEESIRSDMKGLEDHQEIEKFTELVVSWLDFIEADEMTKLTKSNQEIMKKLQDWSLFKDFKELDIFDRHYPKEKQLENFRWLDKSIYKMKKDKFEKVQSEVSSFLSNLGEVKKDKPVFNSVKQLYQLREDIFKIPGDKVVYINDYDQVRTFFVDEFSRVDGEADGIIKFTLTLRDSLENEGSVMVREITNEKFSIQRGKKTVEDLYHNLYGAVLFRNNYKGLPAKEIEDAYNSDDEKPEYNTRFKDWNVGSSFKSNF